MIKLLYYGLYFSSSSSLVNTLGPHFVVYRAVLLVYSSLVSYESGRIGITEAITVTGHKIPAGILFKKRCKS